MSLKKDFKQMVLLLAAILLAGSPAAAQDCGCSGSGFIGGGSVVQGGFAPQAGFAQPQPAHAGPVNAVYDGGFGFYSSNCGRAITNSQAAALWANYNSEDCSLNLPYQRGGGGLHGRKGCGGGCRHGGGFAYPGGQGFGGGGFSQGGGGFAPAGGVGGGCGHGCGLFSRLRGGCGLLGKCRRGGFGGGQVVGYGLGHGAGYAGSYGHFVGSGYDGFGGVGGYGLPLANAGSVVPFAGGGGCRVCSRLKGALSRLIGNCRLRHGGGNVGVSNQVFQSYYQDVGAGPSYFDYALGHQYGTGDFAIESTGVAAGVQALPQQSFPQQTFTGGNAFNGSYGAGAIAAPAIFVPSATGIQGGNFGGQFPQQFVPIQNAVPATQNSCPNCSQRQIQTPTTQQSQFTAPRNSQFATPREPQPVRSRETGARETQFTVIDETQFRGTDRRESATGSNQFASGPAALPAHAAPSRTPVQQGAGSITGETAPLNSFDAGGGF